MFETVFCKSIGGRREQQDNGFIVTENQYLLASIADGLGGHSGGKLASSNVAKTTAQLFHSTQFPIANPQEWIKKAFVTLQQKNAETSIRHYSDALTTVVFLLIQKNYAYWFHLGDSRLYFFSQQKITRTKDHSQVQKLVDLGIIKEEEMGDHHQQNILLGCLGQNQKSLPTYQSRTFAEQDSILLCTDGFWEYFSQKEMQNLVNAENLKANANRAILLAEKRGGPRGDNITLIIIRKAR